MIRHCQIPYFGKSILMEQVLQMRKLSSCFKVNSYGMILSLPKTFTPIRSKIDIKFKNFSKIKKYIAEKIWFNYFLDGHVKLSHKCWWEALLKSDSHLPKNFFVICLIESPFKMMKNAFYSILKALLVLKIIKFLSRLFCHVRKIGLIRNLG